MLEEIYNFLRLSDRLATSGQPSEEQFQEIRRAGFEVVINLGLTDTDYALQDEAVLVHNLGMKYIHIPVIWENPTLENLEEFTSTMEEHQGNRLFVHCAANMRVSVFMALYRILHLGWDRERAMEEVQRIWVPNAIWDGFIQQALSGLVMNRYEDENLSGEVVSKLVTILIEQISRYPRMQLQDLYKLIHQGALGSEHAVEDEESARRWLREEMQILQEGPMEPLIDPISPSGDIVRVNLRPYLHSGKEPDSLLAAFVKTANEYRGSVEVLRQSWAYARRMASEGRLPFIIEEMDAFLAGMAKDGFPAVHHSEVYEEAYRPAYRVVASIYIPELVGKGSNS